MTRFVHPPDWAVRSMWGRSWRTGDVETDIGRQRAAIGVLALMVVVVALGVVHAIGLPPFSPPDETAHVLYSFAVWDGNIPRIDEFPDTPLIPGMPTGLSAWTANHPPLPYLLMGIPLEIGAAVGAPLAGFWAARLLNTVCLALSLLAVGRIATTVVPSRPRLPIIAAGIVGLAPYLHHIGATAYTDGLALLPAVALIAVAVHVLMAGPTRNAQWWAMGLSAACALSRSAALLIVFSAGLAFGLAHVLHRPERAATPGSVHGIFGEGFWSSLRRGVGSAALIGGAAVLLSGWFYALNVARYGDATAATALFELHNRTPRGTFLEHLLSYREIRFQTVVLSGVFEGLPGRPSSLTVPDHHVYWFRWTMSLALIGAVVLAVGNAIRERTVDARKFVIWGMFLAIPAAIYSLMMTFTAAGGAPHARYLWPGWVGLAMITGIAMDSASLPVGRFVKRLPARITLPFAGLVPVAGYVWSNLLGWPVALSWVELADDPSLGFLAAVTQSFEHRLIPAPGLTAWLLTATIVLGTVVAVVAMSTAGGPTVEAVQFRRAEGTRADPSSPLPDAARAESGT